MNNMNNNIFAEFTDEQISDITSIVKYADSIQESEDVWYSYTIPIDLKDYFTDPENSYTETFINIKDNYYFKFGFPCNLTGDSVEAIIEDFSRIKLLVNSLCECETHFEDLKKDFNEEKENKPKRYYKYEMFDFMNEKISIYGKSFCMIQDINTGSYRNEDIADYIENNTWYHYTIPIDLREYYLDPDNNYSNMFVHIKDNYYVEIGLPWNLIGDDASSIKEDFSRIKEVLDRLYECKTDFKRLKREFKKKKVKMPEENYKYEISNFGNNRIFIYNRPFCLISDIKEKLKKKEDIAEYIRNNTWYSYELPVDLDEYYSYEKNEYSKKFVHIKDNYYIRIGIPFKIRAYSIDSVKLDFSRIKEVVDELYKCEKDFENLKQEFKKEKGCEPERDGLLEIFGFDKNTVKVIGGGLVSNNFFIKDIREEVYDYDKLNYLVANFNSDKYRGSKERYIDYENCYYCEDYYSYVYEIPVDFEEFHSEMGKSYVKYFDMGYGYYFKINIPSNLLSDNINFIKKDFLIIKKAINNLNECIANFKDLKKDFKKKNIKIGMKSKISDFMNENILICGQKFCSLRVIKNDYYSDEDIQRHINNNIYYSYEILDLEGQYFDRENCCCELTVNIEDNYYVTFSLPRNLTGDIDYVKKSFSGIKYVVNTVYKCKRNFKKYKNKFKKKYRSRPKCNLELSNLKNMMISIYEKKFCSIEDIIKNRKSDDDILEYTGTDFWYFYDISCKFTLSYEPLIVDFVGYRSRYKSFYFRIKNNYYVKFGIPFNIDRGGINSIKEDFSKIKFLVNRLSEYENNLKKFESEFIMVKGDEPEKSSEITIYDFMYKITSLITISDFMHKNISLYGDEFCSVEDIVKDRKSDDDIQEYVDRNVWYDVNIGMRIPNSASDPLTDRIIHIKDNYYCNIGELFSDCGNSFALKIRFDILGMRSIFEKLERMRRLINDSKVNEGPNGSMDRAFYVHKKIGEFPPGIVELDKLFDHEVTYGDLSLKIYGPNFQERLDEFIKGINDIRNNE